METVHQWAQSLDRRKSVHVDFSNFDSVPHQHLLLKLGLRGNVLAWVSSFLPIVDKD